MPAKGTAKQTPAMWYISTGWRVFNELLCELEQCNLRTVWVENFDSIKGALRGVSKKELISLFNADSLNWKLSIDGGGELYATRNY